MSPHDLHLLWRRAKDICFEHCPCGDKEKLRCKGSSAICSHVFKKVFDNTIKLEHAGVSIKVNCEVEQIIDENGDYE